MFRFGRREDTISLSEKASYEMPSILAHIIDWFFVGAILAAIGVAVIVMVGIGGFQMLGGVAENTVEGYMNASYIWNLALAVIGSSVYCVYHYFSSRREVKRKNRKDYERAQELATVLEPFHDPDPSDESLSESSDWLPYSIQPYSSGCVQAVIKASHAQREETVRISIPSRKGLKKIRESSKSSLKETVSPFDDNWGRSTHSSAAIESLTFPPDLQDWDDGEALLDSVHQEVSRSNGDDKSTLEVEGLRLSGQHILATKLAFRGRTHVYLPWQYLREVHTAVGEFLDTEVEGPYYPQSQILDQIRC